MAVQCNAPLGPCNQAAGLAGCWSCASFSGLNRHSLWQQLQKSAARRQENAVKCQEIAVKCQGSVGEGRFVSSKKL